MLCASCRRLLVLPVLLACADPPPAAAFEGSYRGSYDGQTLKITRAGRAYRVHAEVSVRGCVGEVVAIAQPSGEAIATRRGRYGAGGAEEECRLTIRKTGGGQLAVDEGACLSFHGAACQFEGSYRPSAGRR